MSAARRADTRRRLLRLEHHTVPLAAWKARCELHERNARYSPAPPPRPAFPCRRRPARLLHACLLTRRGDLGQGHARSRVKVKVADNVAVVVVGRTLTLLTAACAARRSTYVQVWISAGGRDPGTHALCAVLRVGPTAAARLPRSVLFCWPLDRAQTRHTVS